MADTQELISKLESFRVGLPPHLRVEATEIIDGVIRVLLTTPEVVIEVLGGIASLHTKSKGVQVTIQDYNTDFHPEKYSEQIWDESDEI